jgi:hypothetical protein
MHAKILLLATTAGFMAVLPARAAGPAPLRFIDVHSHVNGPPAEEIARFRKAGISGVVLISPDHPAAAGRRGASARQCRAAAATLRVQEGLKGTNCAEGIVTQRLAAAWK